MQGLIIIKHLSHDGIALVRSMTEEIGVPVGVSNEMMLQSFSFLLKHNLLFVVLKSFIHACVICNFFCCHFRILFL